MRARPRVEGRPAFETLVRGCGGTPKGDHATVRCPNHDDASPSLSVTLDPDGVVLWKCHGPCDQRELTDTIQRRWPELWDGSQTTARPSAKGAGAVTVPNENLALRHVCFYTYTDEAGAPRHRVERQEAIGKDGRKRKSFPQSHWTGKSWAPGVPEATVGELSLYNLTDIISSAAGGETVWYCEGEKDADRLHALGLVATTNAKAKLTRLDVAPLTGRTVVILVDNDVAGRNIAQEVAAQIAPYAASVRNLELPNLPDHGDVSDWLDAKTGTLEDLVRLGAAAPAWVPPRDPEAVRARALSIVHEYHMTDLGNAERVIAQHGLNLRYVHAWKSWLLWDGMRWQRDSIGGAMRLAQKTIRGLTKVAMLVGWDLEKIARRSESRSRLEGCLALAQDLPGVGIQPDELDRNPWALNVANGTVDLRTCSLSPHRREDYITKIVAYKGTPLSWTPGKENHPPITQFWNFMTRIQPDPHTRLFIQRALGYSLTGSTRERRLFVAHGVGRNGKTTLLELVRDLVGDGYAQVVPSDVLMARKYQSSAGGASPDLASLHGARFVVCAETDQGGRLNEQRIKWLTGEDTVQARRLFEAPFTFTPSHTIWLTTNHRPQVRDGGQALWDRLTLIPFDVRIPDEEQDRSLPSRLRDEEAPGILAWLIEGAFCWYRDGMGLPGSVVDATANYRNESDWFAEFIENTCEVGEGFQVASSDMHRAYASWAAASSERALTPTALGIVLRERGFVASKVTGGKRVWSGVRLQSANTAYEP